jgi:hypothetical protein
MTTSIGPGPPGIGRIIIGNRQPMMAAAAAEEVATALVPVVLGTPTRRVVWTKADVVFAAKVLPGIAALEAAGTPQWQCWLILFALVTAYHLGRET